jgi:hypothetical protein
MGRQLVIEAGILTAHFSINFVGDDVLSKVRVSPLLYCE